MMRTAFEDQKGYIFFSFRFIKDCDYEYKKGKILFGNETRIDDK